jgi:hypothetical protein
MDHKHTSILWKFANYGQKKFYNIGPWPSGLPGYVEAIRWQNRNKVELEQKVLIIISNEITFVRIDFRKFVIAL